MDSRCQKFWDDGEELLKIAGDGNRRTQITGKILKELRTISRFLQKNQSSRFSDNAQQKLVDIVSRYVSFSKQHASEDRDVVEATFQVVKDGLAMPFNVFGTKQKKRLMKWYNELIGIVGGDPDQLLEMEGAEQVQRVEWNAFGVDDEGYLTLMQAETGETNETFQVKKNSKQYKQLRKDLEQEKEVVVVTMGDEIIEIRVDEEAQ